MCGIKISQLLCGYSEEIGSRRCDDTQNAHAGYTLQTWPVPRVIVSDSIEMVTVGNTVNKPVPRLLSKLSVFLPRWSSCSQWYLSVVTLLGLRLVLTTGIFPALTHSLITGAFVSFLVISPLVLRVRDGRSGREGQQSPAEQYTQVTAN